MHRSIASFLLVAAFVALGPQTVRAVDLDWNVPSISADFFTAENWDPIQAPMLADDVFIRNDGDSEAFSGGPLEVNSLTIGDAVNDGDGFLYSRVDVMIADSLLLGAHRSSQEVPSLLAVNGRMTAESAALFQAGASDAENDIHVGYAVMRAGVFTDVEGQLNISNVTTVDLRDDVKFGAAVNEGGTIQSRGGGEWAQIDDVTIGGDLDVSSSDLRGKFAHAGGSTAGVFEARNIETFDVVGDFGVLRTFYKAGDDALFRINHTATANINSIRDMDEFHVGGDMNVGTAVVDFRADAAQVVSALDADLVFERVDEIKIDGDLNLATIRGTQDDSPTTHQQISGFLVNNFDQVDQITVGGGVNVTVVDLDASTGAAQASTNYGPQSQLGMFYSRMTTGRTTSVGVLSGTANVQTSDAYGFLALEYSVLSTPELQVGIVENPSAVGSAAGRVLLAHSFIDTENVVEGPTGEIEFHLDGLARNTLTTFNGLASSVANVYSAIDSADALLEGDIISDFNFIPSPGTYSFDLIQSDSLTALDDTTANLLIQDLPPDFCVIFYGVAEETEGDVLRLTISTNCVPEPGGAVLMAIAFGAIAVRLRSSSRTTGTR
jgi:hypothetical protein